MVLIKVDVILPIYRPHDNWCENICACCQNLRRYFSEHGASLHLHLSNDGSDIAFFPEEKLDRIRETVDAFTFYTYEKNRGKGYSLRHAIASTDGDFQIYTDCDFPFGWESVAGIFDRLAAGADVVMGVRGRDYTDSLVRSRKILSHGSRLMNRLLLGLPKFNQDTQCGLKGFNRRGKELFMRTKINSFLFDTEFIVLAYRAGVKIDVLPLVLRPGLKFSTMGGRVLLRELRNFASVLFIRWFRRRPRL